MRFLECKALEEAGARAAVRQRIEYGSGATTMAEFRDVQAEADSPWLWIRIQRTFVGEDSSRAAETKLRLEGYEPAGEIRQGEFAALKSSAGNPALALYVPATDRIESVVWETGGALMISCRPAESHDFRIGLLAGVPENLDPKALQEEAEFRAEPVCVSMDGGKRKEAVVASPLKHEVIRTVRIHRPSPGPYMVCENGWWQMRGAQPSWHERDTDLLKIILPPKEPTRIRPEGLIDGLARSAWGCQYTQLLREIRALGDNGAAVKVRVVDITPKIWAPRLEFAYEITSAKRNGEDWRYFDGPFLFLPNCRGDHDVEVEFGRPYAPRASAGRMPPARRAPSHA
jgi:hypothetical protein